MMEYKMDRQLQEMKNKRKQGGKRHKVVGALCCVVVFCVIYALMLPAISMTGETYCGIEEHTHSVENGCYEKVLTCGYDETEDASTEPAETGHVHTDACYEEQQTLVCGQEESAGHVHEESCIQTEQQLICTEGHEHSEDCFATVETYICGKTEGEGSHTHEAACYETQKVLVCESPEGEVPEEPHVHTADCYEEVLVCQLEEHEHSLACRSNPEVDVETAADWEKTFEDVDSTGNYAFDLLQIARTQLGYAESEDNYAVETDPDTGEETKNGYTRYGAWYGDAYGDWCAMYISFCLNYAGIPVEDFPWESGVQTWVEKLSGVTEGYEDYDLYREASIYTPVPGDLVFFDWNRDGEADHVGIVAALSEEEADKLSESDRENVLNDVIQALTDANLSAGNAEAMITEVTDALPSETDETTKEESITLITIEGNSENKVQTQAYSLNDAVLLGYGQLPTREEESEPAESGFTVSGEAVAAEYEASAYENLVSVKVTFQGDAAYDGQLPENFQPVLMLEVSDDDPGLEAYESETSYGLMSLGLHLYADAEQTVELDISGCTAQVELTLREALLPGGMSLLSENGEEPTEETTTYLTVFQGEEILASEAVPENAGSAAMMTSNDLDAAEEPLDENIRSGGMTLVYTLNNALSAANVVVSTYSYNPSYTIQHYFWFPQVQAAEAGSTSPQVSFINTEHNGDGTSASVSDKVGNGTSSFNTYDVNLTADNYYLETKEVLKELFIDEKTTYQENPQIQYMSRLYNSLGGSEGEAAYNENYTLSQIWVYQPGYFDSSDETNLTNADFVVYNVPRSSDNSTALPEHIRFTNNPANAHLTVKPVRAENGEWKWDFSGDSTGSAAVIEQNSDAASKNNGQYVVTALSGAEAGYDYDYTILIGEGTIVRLVMEVTTANYSADANFFDYNITDGFIYETASTSTSGTNTNRHVTTDQYGADGTPSRTWYAYTAEQGINSTGNYIGNGAKFAFGQANTGMGLDSVTWSGGTLNKYNSGTYKGLTFGLVQNINSDGTIAWADGVQGPQIFTPGNSLTGKFDYNGTLTFYRQGGTYTLSSASVNDSNGNVISSSASLRQFQNTAGSIYSNEFWVMDDLMGNKVAGHDLAFGDLRTKYGQKAPYYFGNGTGELPCSDTSYSSNTPGDDHNSYFGMSYQVNFTIDPGYSAPLMYWFYGDDDMYVFLTKYTTNENGQKIVDTSFGNEGQKLVADIGGVHSSAGMMVNLWDYVEKIPFEDASGNKNQPQSYTLRIYYTERGASGSTCYMRFTVPLDSITQTRVQGEEAIVVEKELQNEYGEAVAYTPATENNPRPTFGVDLTYFDEYDASDAAQATAHNAAVEWVEEQAENGYFIYRIRLYDSGSELPYQDLYHYGIYKVGEDHTTANPLATGDLGSASTVSGDYYFALRSGEYIAITGLFEGTAYSIRELTSDKYLTSYQVGSHAHVNGVQVDTLNPDAYYGDRAGTPDRLPVKTGDVYTNYVKFFNSPSTKTETNPGNGKQVNVGDVVTYEIEWINDTAADAAVTINDLLDPGVTFVAAWFGDSTQGTEGNKLTAEDVSGTLTDSTGTITYDAGARKVTWSTQSTGNNDRGIVTLQVRVNEDAKDHWNYFNDPDVEYGGSGGGSDDYQIVNQAQIQVGNNTYLTNIPYNPVRDTRVSGIYKVDQYGEPVAGATFEAYQTDENYVVADGATPTLTITTGAKGEVQFRKNDNTVYSLAELHTLLGDYFVLKETGIPEGYRTVSEEIHLYFDGDYLLVDGRTVSGASAAANATVTVNSPYLYRATPKDGKYYYVNGTTPYYTTGSDGKIAAENGTLFAVVLKKNGSTGTVDEWYPVVRDADGGFSVSDSTGVAAAIDAAQSMGQSVVFTPNDSGSAMEVSLNRLPGSITQYFTYQWEKAKNDPDRTIASVRNESEYFVAYYYTTASSLDYADTYNTVRVVSRDGIITGTTGGVEGNNGSNPTETYPGFGISWATTIQITNYENRLFFQKRDESESTSQEDGLLNGAVFALYKAHDNVKSDGSGTSLVYYEGTTNKDAGGAGERVLIIPYKPGVSGYDAAVPYRAAVFSSTTADSASHILGIGTYTIETEGEMSGDGMWVSTGGSTEPGLITVTITETRDSGVSVGSKYYVHPATNADGDPLVGVTHDSCDVASEAGTGHFTKLKQGEYVLREIKSPSGYGLNVTDIPVVVNDIGVFANAGIDGDRVAVGNGLGYLTKTLEAMASQDGINETLTWVYGALLRSDATGFTAFSDVVHDVIHVEHEGEFTDWYFVGKADGDPLGYGSRQAEGRSNALVTYYEYSGDLSQSNAIFDYVPNSDQTGRSTAGQNPATRQGEGTYRLWAKEGWSTLAAYQDYAFGLSKTQGRNTKYSDLTALGNIANLFSSSTFVQVTDELQAVDLTIKKVQSGNTSGNGLEGATFRLRRETTNGTKVWYQYDATTGVTWVTNESDATSQTTNDDGIANFYDLAPAEDAFYCLEEVEAPDGFHLLTTEVKLQVKSVTTTGRNIQTEMTMLYPLGDASGIVLTGNETDSRGAIAYTLTVPNNSGVILPETGGVGTALFTVFGLALMLGAGVLLIVRRRQKA